MQIITMDRFEAEEYAPGKGHEAIISIRSPGAHPVRLSPHFTDVLTLTFHDFEQAFESQIQVISEAQAAEVAEFLQRNIHADRLIVHCEAGISRSVSMAAAIADFIQMAAPNWTVYRRVMEALHARREILHGISHRVQGPHPWQKARRYARKAG